MRRQARGWGNQDAGLGTQGAPRAVDEAAARAPGPRMEAAAEGKWWGTWVSGLMEGFPGAEGVS